MFVFHIILWVILVFCVLWICTRYLPSGVDWHRPFPEIIALIPLLWVPIVIIGIFAIVFKWWWLLCVCIAVLIWLLLLHKDFWTPGRFSIEEVDIDFPPLDSKQSSLTSQENASSSSQQSSSESSSEQSLLRQPPLLKRPSLTQSLSEQLSLDNASASSSSSLSSPASSSSSLSSSLENSEQSSSLESSFDQDSKEYSSSNQLGSLSTDSANTATNSSLLPVVSTFSTDEDLETNLFALHPHNLPSMTASGLAAESAAESEISANSSDSTKISHSSSQSDRQSELKTSATSQSSAESNSSAQSSNHTDSSTSTEPSFTESSSTNTATSTTISPLIAPITVDLVTRRTLERAHTNAPLTLHVMTLNCRYGRANVEDIIHAVHKYHIDVLALQEVTDSLLHRLGTADFIQELPWKCLGRSSQNDNGGTNALFCRHKPFFASDKSADIHAAHVPLILLNHPNGEVAVASVHPKSPQRGGSFWGYGVSHLFDIVAHAEKVESREIPTIIMGDLNSSIHHPSFRRTLANGLHDAALVYHKGIKATFPNSWPGFPRLLNLDHILFKGHIAVKKLDVVSIKGTDHAGLAATLVIKQTRHH